MTLNGHENNSAHYSMIIEWSTEDEVYIVTVPELPGCRTHGRTREEAVRMGEEVIELWLEGVEPPPAPQTFTYWSNLDRIVLTPTKLDTIEDRPVKSRSA